MYVEMITPEKTLFTGEADLIQLPGLDGSFEILKNHAPLIAFLKKGNVKVVDPEKNKHLIEINGGVIEVKKNKVIILAE